MKFAIGGIVEETKDSSWCHPKDYCKNLNIAFSDPIYADHIDTAQRYRDAEKTLSIWVQQKKSIQVQPKVCSKVSYNPDPDREFDASMQPYSKGMIIDSCKKSLQNVGIDHFYIYYLHAPFPEKNDWLEILQAFNQLLDDGCIKNIGLSNFYRLEDIEAILEICQKHGLTRPLFIQNVYNLLFAPYTAELYTKYKDLEFSIGGYSPTAEGLLTGKHTFTLNHAELLKGSRIAARPSRFPHDFWKKEAFEAVNQLRSYCSDIQRDMISVVYSWTFLSKTVDFCLLGPKKPSHFEAIVDAIKSPISDVQYKEVSEIFVSPLGADYKV